MIVGKIYMVCYERLRKKVEEYDTLKKDLERQIDKETEPEKHIEFLEFLLYKVFYKKKDIEDISKANNILFIKKKK